MRATRRIRGVLSFAGSPVRRFARCSSFVANQERPRVMNAEALVRVLPDAIAGETAFGFERALLLLAEILELPAAGALQAAAVNELDDRVQLARVEERAVALAHVDHDAGD